MQSYDPFPSNSTSSSYLASSNFNKSHDEVGQALTDVLPLTMNYDNCLFSHLGLCDVSHDQYWVKARSRIAYTYEFIAFAPYFVEGPLTAITATSLRIMLQGYYPYNEAWWWQHYIVGTGRLVKVEGKINAAMYKVIIDINLLQSTVVLGLEQRLIFQQAKKLKQKSKTRKQWLLDHSVNVFE